jgi:hypothetical protein
MLAIALAVGGLILLVRPLFRHRRHR